MTGFTIRATTDADRSQVAAFIRQYWGSEQQFVRGVIFIPHELPGFVAEVNGEFVGLITYRFLDDTTCEVATLNSLRSGRGIGTALIMAVVNEAKAHDCTRLVVVTTNENLNALRFYQKRGFVLAELRPNAVAAARQFKPEIPLLGADDIPIRDEIQLEMALNE